VAQELTAPNETGPLPRGCGRARRRLRQRRRPPLAEEARRCLEQLDLHVTPWERPPNDDDGPTAMLDANDVLRARVRVEAQYYDDAEEAERYEPAQRRSARTHDGAVERHGTLTLLWLRGHGQPLAERTRDCLL